MTVAILGVILLRFVIPVAVIIFIVWQVKKLNSVDRTVREILEKLREND